MNIPLNDLERGVNALRSEIDRAVARVLDRGYFVLGPENAAFEAELSEYLGADSILVGNGTDALQLALTAVGVGRGDGVLTVANAGGYTSTAVRALGAEPIYVDVERQDLLASISTVTDALASTDLTPTAIVVTHLYGSVVNIEPIARLARSQGIAVIEDCAQALGATIDGRKVGTFGDLATVSFYPTKNLGALGDGGAVLTPRPDLAAAVRQLRQYGWKSKYQTTLSGGMNSRLDEMQAAILRVKLPHLDAWNERRRTIHAEYSSAVGSGARLVSESHPGFGAHLAVLDTGDRARAEALFAEAAIRTEVHYPIPDHQQALLAHTSPRALPETERAAERVLSVPLFPELTEIEVARVCSVLGSL